MNFRKFLWLPLAVYVGLGITAARAEFPDHAITFIVPFGAGGGFDSLARKIAEPLSHELGVPVVVKNVPGSGGRTGSIDLFRAKADGYTIGLPHFVPFITDHVLFGRKPPFDYKKFSMIRMVASLSTVLYVKNTSPIKNFNDLKNSKDVVSFTNTGVGSNVWVSVTALSNLAKFKVRYVSGYKSLVVAALGVVRGDADAGIAGYKQLAGVIGDIRPIVYFYNERSPKFPNTPTVSEVGYPNLADIATPYVVSAPPGTPADRLSKIEAALKKVVQTTAYKTWAVDQGYVVADKGPKDALKTFTGIEQVYKDVAPLVAASKKK